MIASLRKKPVWQRRIERAIDFARQWPWVYPRGGEPSTIAWVQRSKQSSGWYAGLRAHWFESVHPGGTCLHEPPVDVPEGMRAAFDQVAATQYPEAFVAYISGAHLVGDAGFVLTPDNRILAEYHHEFNVRSLRGAILKKPFSLASLKVQRIPEPVGLLAAPEGWNHYHWLFDVLPRVHLLGRWQAIIKHWAVSSRLTSVQIESLKLLDIDRSQLLRLHAGERLRCQHLYAPSLPGSEGCTPPWVPKFLRERLLPPVENVPGNGPAIYVMRGTNSERPVINEAELIAHLVQRGFRAIDPSKMSFAEQIATFRDARHIVAAHGAALANLVFASDANIVELLSADYPRVDCYFTLSRQMGLNYECMLDPRTSSSGKPWGGISVNIDALAKRLAT